MENQPPLYQSDSSVISSTSSYSQIIPRDQFILKVRRDRPIVIRSIPITKQRVQVNVVVKQQHDEMAKTMSETGGNLIGVDNSGVNDKVDEVVNSVKRVQQKTTEMYHNVDQCGVRIQGEQGLLIVQVSSGRQDSCNEIVNESNNKSCYQRQNTLINSVIGINNKNTGTCQSSPDNTILNYSVSSQASSGKPVTTKTMNKKAPHNTQHQQPQYSQQQQYTRNNNNTEQQQQQQQLQDLLQRNQQLQQRLKWMQWTLKRDSQSIQLQRKANEIYTELYHALTKIISQFLKLNPPSIDLTESQRSISGFGNSQLLNQTLNMDKVINTVGRLIESYQRYAIMINTNSSSSSKQTLQLGVQTEAVQGINDNIENASTIGNYAYRINDLQQIVDERNQQIIKLKSQLLQSTQNNINAIFNTQLSPECCLDHSLKKISTQITTLKNQINLILISNNNQQQQQQPQHYYTHPHPQIIYLPQPNFQPNFINKNNSPNEIINIQSSDNQQASLYEKQQSQQPQNNKTHSLNKNSNKHSQSKSSKQLSSQSSMMSSKQTKKREQMSRREIEQLRQAYNKTKDQLNALVSTFSMINGSQQQMRAYFNVVKEGLLREVSEKWGRVREENEGEIDRRVKEKRREQQQSQGVMRENEQRYQQLIQQNKLIYQNQLQSLQTQHTQDQQTISQLNNMLLQLSHKTSVPQRLTPQLQSKRFNPELIHQQQFPMSQISISVDWLRLIEGLKQENLKQKEEINTLERENAVLKKEIQMMSVVGRDQDLMRKNVYYSDPKKRKGSIINDLNELSISSKGYNILPIRTKEGFELHKNKFYGKVKQGLESLEYIELPGIKIQQKQNYPHLQSQRNHTSNIKAILQSKQARIKNLQKQIINLQQTAEYLKQQLSLRDKVIRELETYIGDLQCRSSENGNCNEEKRINYEPEINVQCIKENNNIGAVKTKYQNYVKNLKLLLKETKNQNHWLKQRLLGFQQTQRLDTSAVHSQRTTTNFLTSTSPTNHRSLTEIVMRKKQQQSSPFENQLREQRINTFSQ